MTKKGNGLVIFTGSYLCITNISMGIMRGIMIILSFVSTNLKYERRKEMNWFDELDDGAKVVVIGTAAIAGTVILWKGITTAEKISKDISEKKYQAMLPPEYWIAKKTEAEKAAEKAKIEAEASIQKNKDRLEYESKMPPEYFKLKETEETNASKERIAKIEAETKIKMINSEHKLTEKALSEHTWQNIRNVGALTTTANHAINAFANASREVRLHGNN